MKQWWMLRDWRSGSTVAMLNGTTVNRRNAQRISQKIATVLDTQLEIFLKTLPNPTLVHHGLARDASWHVLWDVNGAAMADLYTPARQQARAITQAISDIMGAPMRLLDNVTRPKTMGGHRVDLKTARPKYRRLNPGRTYTEAQYSTPSAMKMIREQFLGPPPYTKADVERVAKYMSTTLRIGGLRVTRALVVGAIESGGGTVENPARSKAARRGRVAKRRAYGSRRIRRAADTRARAMRVGGSGASELARFGYLSTSRARRGAKQNAGPPLMGNIFRKEHAPGWWFELHEGRRLIATGQNLATSAVARAELLRSVVESHGSGAKIEAINLWPNAGDYDRSRRGRAANPKRRKKGRPRGWPVPIGGGWDTVSAKTKAGSIASGETTEADWIGWYRAATGLEPPKLKGRRANPKGRFTRQPATIARTAEHYYELRSPGIETIGGQTKAQLIAWARTHGFAPIYVDERKPELRAQPFLNPKERFSVCKTEDLVHSASVGDYTQAVFEVVDGQTGKVVMRSYNQHDARTEAAYRNKHDPRGAFTRIRTDLPSRKNPAIHFDRKSLPEIGSRIVAAAFPSYRGNKFQLSYADSVHVNNLWSGGSKEDTVFVRLDTMQVYRPPDTYGAGAQETPVPEGVVVVQHVMFTGTDLGIRFVVPRSAARLFPLPEADVNRDELIVLEATRSLKSSYGGVSDYRFREAHQETGITRERWDAAKVTLIGKAMLNKAGAITAAGRTAAGNVRLRDLKGNPKRRSRSPRRPKPNPESEVRRARRTFRKWHEFDAHRVTRVKAPARIPKTMVKLGDLVSVVYRSNKYTGKPTLYEHKTKRPQPVLATDPDGREVHIVGGNMKVTADGLVN